MEKFTDGSKPSNPKDMVGSDKVPIHLWPSTATVQGALALLDGMLKYGRTNWRSIGVRASIYFDAAQRHMDAWFEGENLDPDSRLSHLAHALACIAIIIDAEAAGKLRDDRMIRGGYRKLLKSMTPTWGGGRAWHITYVKKILDNRAVIGEFQPCVYQGPVKRIPHGDPIPDYYPAVISKELFATVQQIRKERPTYTGRGTFSNPFSKLMFDEETGTPINCQKRGAHHYLISWAARRGEAKEWSTWRMDDFKECFIAVALEGSIQDKPEGSGGSELAAKHLELSDCEKQIEKWIGILDRTESNPAAEQKLVECEKKKSAIKAQIGELESQSIAKPTDISEVNWRDDATLRDNLRATVKRITMNATARTFRVDFFDGRKGMLAVRPDGHRNIVFTK